MNLAQISSSVIFITMITILAGEHVFYSNTPSDFYLPSYIIPMHYHVNLFHLYTHENSIWEDTLSINYENDSFIFSGTSSITINILQSTHNIRLHSLHPIVNNDEVKLIRSDGKIYQMTEYTSEENIIDFDFGDVLTPELYTIKIQFFGQLVKRHAQNFFEYSDSNDKKNIIWLISPTIQTTGLGQLFPCWNEAHLKATFKMSMKHHRNYTVLFNMPPILFNLQVNYDENFLWTHFYVTPPISIFQFAIVLTTFPKIHINENIRLWCEKCSNEQSVNLEFVKVFIKNVTLHLKSQFSDINIPKMDHIAIPNFPYHVTSKWGLIFHREADLIYDEQIDAVMRKIQIARLIAPKIAYQWFSNVLSTSWWSYFWLHDGLAILFGEEAIVKTFNKSELMDFFQVQSLYDSLHLDSHQISMNPTKINSLSQIDSIFSFPRSMKVLVVLRMFQHEISIEDFRKNVQTYLRRHIFSSNSYEFSPIHEILDWKTHNVSNEFLIWMENEGYPVVTWSQKSTEGILFQMYDYGKLWIPVTLHYPNLAFPSLDIKKVFLHPKQMIVTIQIDNPYSWRIVNFKPAGYFRAKYDNNTMSVITKFINIQQVPLYKTINAISRAKIIDDAFHFMIKRQFNVSVFWDLTRYLSANTDYVAWYPMIKIFEYMSTLVPFSVEEVKYIDIKEKFRKLLDNPLKTLGFEEDPLEDDFTKYLRQEIVKWSCLIGYDKCIQTAHNKLEAHLKDPKKTQLLPGWRQWTYCKGLSVGHSFKWFNLIKRWFKDPQPNNNELLPYLVCSGLNVNSSLSFIAQFIQGKRQEIESYNRTYIHIFHSISTKLAVRYTTLERMLNKLNDIKPKEINILIALVNIINHMYSETDLWKLSDYLQKIKQNETIFSLTESQLSKVQHKIQLRYLEIDNHINYFKFISDS